MKMDAKFWIAQIVFQVVFGLAVFGITRAIYVKDMTPPLSSTSRGSPVTQTPPPRPQPVPSLSETDPLRLSDQADEWFNVGDFPRAREAYARLLEMAPENPEYYNNLGLAQQYLGQSGEAIATLEKGRAYASEYPRLWLTLGFVRARQGLYDDARTALARAVEIAPESDIAQEARQMMQQLP